MTNIKYVIKRLGKMNYKAMINKINAIHNKTSMSRMQVFRDMKNCAVRYGARVYGL